MLRGRLWGSAYWVGRARGATPTDPVKGAALWIALLPT